MHVRKVLLNDVRAFVLEASTRMAINKESLSPSKPPEYSESVKGTYNYDKALQLAFNRVKQQVFFNPDMTFFVTLTYKGVEHTPKDVLRDLKVFMLSQRRKGFNPKYVAVMEYQKRGSIHVHMISNNQFNLKKNKNGYYSLIDWKHGFTSILTIKDFDQNFKPYLYLFKYMKKSQRIGKSFVYASRNLNNFSKVDVDKFETDQYDRVTTERTKALMPDGKVVYYNKYYFQRRK